MPKQNLAAIVSTLHDAGMPPRLGRDLGRLLKEAWRLVAEGRPVPVPQLEEVAAELKIPGFGAAEATRPGGFCWSTRRRWRICGWSGFSYG